MDEIPEHLAGPQRNEKFAEDCSLSVLLQPFESKSEERGRRLCQWFYMPPVSPRGVKVLWVIITDLSKRERQG